MTQSSYHQFCPVAMASEILGSRWTIVLLRELCAGSTRFNDLRRGVPRMSPALLSRRLKELEKHGIVERRVLRKTPEQFDYVLTPSGEDVREVVMAIGLWGQRWVETRPSLENLDPGLLMWDMRRNLDTASFPDRRVTIQFHYTDLPRSTAKWWILHEPATGTDLCSVDPGFDVDLFVHTDIATLTSIWMGLDRVKPAVEDGRLDLVGDPRAGRSDAGLARPQSLCIDAKAARVKQGPSRSIA